MDTKIPQHLTDADLEVFDKADAALERVRDLSATIAEQVTDGDLTDLDALVKARAIASSGASVLIAASTEILRAKGLL